MNAPKYQETVIPCRPTDPNKVTMKFFKGATEDITDRLSDYLYEYDPERGLVITRGAAEFHQGMVVCVATRYDDKHMCS